MKKQKVIKSVSATIALVFVTPIFAVGKSEIISLTAEGKKLEAYYSKMEADLRAEITRLEPKVDEKKKAEFAKKFGTLESVPPVKKVVMGNEVAVKYGPDNPAFVEKQKEVLAAARVVMKDVDGFLIGEKALATMAKFALLTDATPGRLAEFSQKGKDEKALIDKLLNDDELVVQAMTMGGASGGKYGQAMRSYTAIQKASPRSHEGFFQSWALAVSLQYTGETYVYPDAPAADSLVKYYMNYLHRVPASLLQD